jgi:hypothetical protein
MQSCPKVQDIQISERSPVENRANGNPIKTHKACTVAVEKDKSQGYPSWTKYVGGKNERSVVSSLLFVRAKTDNGEVAALATASQNDTINNWRN